MDFTEKTLTQEYQFKGRIIKCRTDTALLPDGTECYREVCEHPGGVGVLPITKEGEVILVRQFRYPYGETLLEIPAGKLDHGPNEDPAGCAVRELKEETGFTAGRMVALGKSYPSPGFLTEILHAYCALDLVPGESQPDEGEFVEVVRLPIREVERQIASGELCDGKTMIAMYRARLLGLLDGFDH
ncbi:MAG: NUDIX hydrolase [Clostridiaceae bacterium]|nr:NUDIX hydrolase [Clostridiaceae bacterium]